MVAQEQYDLVMRREMLDDPRIITLISLIKSPEFKAHLDRSGAYCTNQTGRVRSISSDNLEIPPVCTTQKIS
jgi:putative molybdopterin biosynthesis protein